MLRTSNISTPSTFALERQREDLRDRRWERRCRVMRMVGETFGKTFWALVLGGGALLRLLGWI
jgi:hypothetical protein